MLKTCDLGISLQFGSTTISPTDCKGDNWKSLGIKLDATLCMERQINSVRQKCNWTMMNLRTIGRYLNEGTKLMMVKQLVISKLDYCNSLYINLKKTLLNKLKSILNGAVRFIYNISDRSIDLVQYCTRRRTSCLLNRGFFLKYVCLHTKLYMDYLRTTLRSLWKWRSQQTLGLVLDPRRQATASS